MNVITSKLRDLKLKPAYLHVSWNNIAKSKLLESKDKGQKDRVDEGSEEFKIYGTERDRYTLYLWGLKSSKKIPAATCERLEKNAVHYA